LVITTAKVALELALRAAMSATRLAEVPMT
jgi:hypothetical protein